MSTIANKLLTTARNKFPPDWVNGGYPDSPCVLNEPSTHTLYDYAGSDGNAYSSPIFGTTVNAGTDICNIYDNDSNTYQGITTSTNTTVGLTYARYYDPNGATVRIEQLKGKFYHYSYKAYYNNAPSAYLNFYILPVAGPVSSLDVSSATKIGATYCKGLTVSSINGANWLYNMGQVTINRGSDTGTSVYTQASGSCQIRSYAEDIPEMTQSGPFYIVTFLSSYQPQSSGATAGGHITYARTYEAGIEFSKQ